MRNALRRTLFLGLGSSEPRPFLVEHREIGRRPPVRCHSALPVSVLRMEADRLEKLMHQVLEETRGFRQDIRQGDD